MTHPTESVVVLLGMIRIVVNGYDHLRIFHGIEINNSSYQNAWKYYMGLNVHADTINLFVSVFIE